MLCPFVRTALYSEDNYVFFLNKQNKQKRTLNMYRNTILLYIQVFKYTSNVL